MNFSTAITTFFNSKSIEQSFNESRIIVTTKSERESLKIDKLWHVLQIHDVFICKGEIIFYRCDEKNKGSCQ